MFYRLLAPQLGVICTQNSIYTGFGMQDGICVSLCNVAMSKSFFSNVSAAHMNQS